MLSFSAAIKVVGFQFNGVHSLIKLHLAPRMSPKRSEWTLEVILTNDIAQHQEYGSFTFESGWEMGDTGPVEM